MPIKLPEKSFQPLDVRIFFDITYEKSLSVKLLELSKIFDPSGVRNYFSM